MQQNLSEMPLKLVWQEAVEQLMFLPENIQLEQSN